MGTGVRVGELDTSLALVLAGTEFADFTRIYNENDWIYHQQSRSVYLITTPHGQPLCACHRALVFTGRD